MFFRKTPQRTTLPKPAASGFQNLRQIAQDAVGLGSNVSSDHLLGGGIDRDLAGDENESVGFDGLRVRADGLRGVFGGNDFAHENKFSVLSSQLSVLSKTQPT